MAFGKDFEEVREANVKVDLPSLHLVLATKQTLFENDGQVTFAPCWYARFDNVQGAPDETAITTLRCEKARFRFDGPVRNLSDLNNHKVISIEPSGNVRIAFSSPIPKARP